MEKLNIAELLKDCPKGMELDCTMFENLEFERINKDDKVYSIICRVKTEWGSYNFHSFNIYGCYSNEKYSKCVIFPKGKTTWDGFVPPCKFKDGDILFHKHKSNNIKYIFIYKRRIDKHYLLNYCGWFSEKPLVSEQFNVMERVPLYENDDIRFATEEEKQKLFDAIKAKGYKWNTETKTLEKIIVPKFKVGDKIVEKDNPFKYWYVQGIDTYCNSDFYYIVTKGQVSNLHFKDQDNWELVPNKFDISTLKAYDKVLVRDTNEQVWVADLFSHVLDRLLGGYTFACVGHYPYQCIPYLGNEHLLGTTNDCDEYYKNW